MSDILPFVGGMVPAASNEAHEKIERLIDAMKSLDAPKPDIKIHQMLHAGCYVRTAFFPKDTIMASCQLLVPTVLIVSGDCVITDTERTVRIQGYEVLTGARMRQGIIRTLKDT